MNMTVFAAWYFQFHQSLLVVQIKFFLGTPVANLLNF